MAAKNANAAEMHGGAGNEKTMSDFPQFTTDHNGNQAPDGYISHPLLLRPIPIVDGTPLSWCVVDVIFDLIQELEGWHVLDSSLPAVWLAISRVYDNAAQAAYMDQETRRVMLGGM